MSPSATESQRGELIELPNGTRLYYVDKNHAYFRCKEDGNRGTRYTGVTTAIAPISFKPDGLMKWAARLNSVGIAQLVSEALEHDYPETIRAQLQWLDPNDPNRIWDMLTRAKLTYEDIRDAKGVVGTNVHELALKALATGQPTPNFDELTEEEKGYSKAVIDFWLDHNPEPLQVEQIVANEELGVAGRFDLRGRFKKCNDELCPCQKGGIGLIDAKTGNYISDKDHVQVALYAHLAEGCGFGVTDWTGILHVTAEGEYRLWEGQADRDMAISSIELYRHAGTLSNRCRKDWKVRRGYETV